MKLKTVFWLSCLFVAMVASAIPASASKTNECAAGQPTAASNTWDFKGEANAIFKEVQSDAREALYHADMLQSFTGHPTMSWESYAGELDQLCGDINDIGAKLCRLETIRRVVAPWQQRVIDRIATNDRLMADNAQDAIAFGSDNQQALWRPRYHDNLKNLYNEAESLERAVVNAVEFAGVSKEYKDLEHSLGGRTNERILRSGS